MKVWCVLNFSKNYIWYTRFKWVANLHAWLMRDDNIKVIGV